MRNELPNFLLVGAHKSATTSIMRDLASHPDVFVPRVKEPHFFLAPELRQRLPNIVSEEDEYRRLFQDGTGKLWRGEGSVFYLPYHEVTIPRLVRWLGSELRILISLRNPVDRAYSAYLDVARANRLEGLPTFRASLAAETNRERSGYGPPSMYYRRHGNYATSVQAYLQTFPHVHIVLFDDYVHDWQSAIREVSTFLEIEPSKQTSAGSNANEGSRVWSSRGARVVAQHPLVTWVRRRVKALAPGAYQRVRDTAQKRYMRRAPGLESELRAELASYYRPDIIRLERLIGRDLSAWLDPVARPCTASQSLSEASTR